MILKNGQKVLWRRGCAGTTGPIWENQFQPGILQVVFRDRDMPKAYRGQSDFWRKGDPCSISIKDMIDWAEYQYDDLSEKNGVYELLCEDYYLEFTLI